MAGGVSVYPNAEITVAIIAGNTHQMDEGANRVLLAVKAAAAKNRDTGGFIRNLSVVKAPGERGRGRRVTDRLIVADDPGSAAIEFGYIRRVAGGRRVQYVPGQHPMRRGMNSA
ncbi:DUF5403 family protein [Microbacterium binotii]|uniref:Uncharacterized protein n=1 Tax=Microbacterium binotii TaxID=462710 RepID=A0ABN3PE30_9MICO